MPIIEQLNQKGYELTVIAKEKEWAKLKQFKMYLLFLQEIVI